MYGMYPRARVGVNPYLARHYHAGAPILPASAAAGAAVPSFALANGGVPAIVPDVATTGVDVPFGMPVLTALAAAASGTTTNNSPGWFRPSRYVVPSGIAADFVINSISIGVRSCLGNNSGNVVAAIFSELAVDCGVTFFTAGPGIPIAVNVTNISAGAVSFASTFRGAFVDGASGGQAIVG
jgi:hypothetical protein